jgi:protein SCO1
MEMSQRAGKWLFVIALCLVSWNIATTIPSENPSLRVLWPVPEFELNDQHGLRITKASLQGHVWIANFVFTTCTNVCPMLTARLRILQRKLSAPELRFVSFSVDPEHDTSAALRRYAEVWAQHETRWHLLRSDPRSLKRLVDGMRVVAEPTHDKLYPIVHTSLFFLVDAAGDVRGMFDSDDEKAMTRLFDAAQELARPAVATRSPSTLGLGASQFVELGCAGCHDNAALAPTLQGLAGREVSLADGTKTRVDAAYLRESITRPSAKLVAGYVDTMPSYESSLTDSQVNSLVDYLPALSPAAISASAQSTTSAVDPVCGMTVRVTSSTPSASHDGRQHYFCSDACRSTYFAGSAR